MEATELVGDDVRVRWNALLKISGAVSGNDAPDRARVYRPAQVTESLAPYLDDALDHEAAIHAIGRLDPREGIAVASRGRDRRLEWLDLAIKALAGRDDYTLVPEPLACIAMTLLQQRPDVLGMAGRAVWSRPADAQVIADAVAAPPRSAVSAQSGLEVLRAAAKALAAELNRTDLLGRWVAHYIAEQVTAAESAAESDREAREQAAAGAPGATAAPCGPAGRPATMHAFERVFLALDRLAEPQDPWRFYRPFPEGTEPSPEDVISSTILSLALNVEDSAREIVRVLIAKAAATALDHEAQWVRLNENLAEDEERQAIRRVGRLMQLSEESVGNPEAMEPLERVQAHITQTIEQLAAISDAITEVRRDQEA